MQLPEISIYLDMALQNRPDLKQVRELLEANKYNFYGSIVAFGPTVAFNATLNYSNRFDSVHPRYGNPPVGKKRTSKGSLTHSFNISWEIFSGGRTYFNMRNVEANMKIAEFQLVDKWSTVINEVRSAYDNYQTNL